MPTRVSFGHGKIQSLNDEIPPSAKKIFLVTDHDLFENTPIISKIQGLLSDRKLQVYHDIHENPTLESVKQGSRVAKAFHPDYVLGIGGGSAMDAAKGMAGASGKLPIVCIPTTSGTGSEVTPFAVFTDPENNEKLGFSEEHFFPKLSIIDPELSFSMPESLILNTGLDSLAHAVEAFLSKDSFIMNDRLALESIELVIQHLPQAYRRDKKAMELMSYSAMLSGVAIAHASTILPHIMGYPLTVYHDVPHGRAGIIMLPAYLSFLEKNKFCQAKVGLLKDKFKVFGNLESFLNDLGVSCRLSKYGVRHEELDNYVKKTIKKNDVAISPGNIDEKIILELYQQSL